MDSTFRRNFRNKLCPFLQSVGTEWATLLGRFCQFENCALVRFQILPDITQPSLQHDDTSPGKRVETVLDKLDVGLKIGEGAENLRFPTVDSK